MESNLNITYLTLLTKYNLNILYLTLMQIMYTLNKKNKIEMHAIKLVNIFTYFIYIFLCTLHLQLLKQKRFSLVDMQLDKCPLAQSKCISLLQSANNQDADNTEEKVLSENLVRMSDEGKNDCLPEPSSVCKKHGLQNEFCDDSLVESIHTA